MEIFGGILGAIFIIVGLIGCIIPGLPGPPFSYIGVLMLQLGPDKPFTWKFILTWGIITVVATALDYIVPAFGTKKFGGSSRGVWGSVIGLFLGMFFFPPLGIIIGPFVGAILGELSGGKNTEEALRAGFGSFIGFLTGTVLKLIVSGMLTYYFFINLF